MSLTLFAWSALGIVLASTAWSLHRGRGVAARIGRASSYARVFAAALVLSLCGFQTAANASVGNDNTTETGTTIGRTATGFDDGPARAKTVNDYAARQAQSKKAENFEGGSTTIVIGSSALVVILVVLLIVVIL